MKFYDSIGPNPRVVRMVMAEKGISLPTETIDIMAGVNRSGDYIKKVPAGGTPALELDDGRIMVAGGPSIDALPRLKSEYDAALVAAGIAVEVVPGITAGVAVPAYAGIPITHRSQSSSVTFVTGHESAGKYRPKVNWRALAQGSETIVVYMGIHNLGPITAELLAADLSPSTPVALIRWGTYPQQETLIGTLETIVAQVAAAGFDAPAVAVIGAVVNWHDVFKHCRPTGTLWPD